MFYSNYLGTDTRGPQCAATTDCGVERPHVAQVEFLCSRLPPGAPPLVSWCDASVSKYLVMDPTGVLLHQAPP